MNGKNLDGWILLTLVVILVCIIIFGISIWRDSLAVYTDTYVSESDADQNIRVMHEISQGTAIHIHGPCSIYVVPDEDEGGEFYGVD